MSHCIRHKSTASCDVCSVTSLHISLFKTTRILRFKLKNCLDGEASGCQTDSEELTHHEDIVEQSSVIQPYMFEPETTTGETKPMKMESFVKPWRIIMNF